MMTGQITSNLSIYNNGLLEPGKVELFIIMIRVNIQIICTLNNDIYGDLLVTCLWSVMREFAYNIANLIITS